MKQNKIHSTSEDFRRYLENEMSEPERNQFERKLEKNAFEKEALEGFNQTPGINFQKDLTEIKTKLHASGKKKTFQIFAAAASILLVISSGIIWFQLNKNDALPEVVENKIEQVQPNPLEKMILPEITGVDSVTNENKIPEVEDEIVVSKKAVNEVAEIVEVKESEPKPIEKSIPLQGIIDAEIAVQSVPESAEKASSQKVIRIRGVSSINQAQTSDNRITEFNSKKSTNKTVSGKVIEAGTNQPLPGVTIVEKGTQNGIVSDMDGKFNLELQDSNSILLARFVGMDYIEIKPNSDSDIVIQMQPSQRALSEVVSIGYGKVKKSNQELLEIENDRTAQPTIGMDKYKDYIKENALLQADYPKKKERIKIKFEINEAGKTIRFQNMNRTDSLLFEKAKDLIITGPMWQAEIKNGEEISSEQMLRITFRKK